MCSSGAFITVGHSVTDPHGFPGLVDQRTGGGEAAGSRAHARNGTGPTMTESLRTFVAIELPRQLAACLGRIQDQLRGHRFNVRWVRPENIHLTLKFLGDTPAADLTALVEALAEAVRGHPPLGLFLKGFGAFPGLDRPRVVWVGIDGQIAELQALQRAVEGGLGAIGFPSGNRPFRGHLTLGRVKGRVAGERLRSVAETLQTFVSERFAVDRIVLLRSELNPTGAVYTRLSTVDLDPDGPPGALSGRSRGAGPSRA